MRSFDARQNGTVRSRSGLTSVTANARLAGLILMVALGVLLVGLIKARTWSQLSLLEQEFAAMRTELFYVGVNARSTLWHLNGAVLRYQLSKDTRERERFVEESAKLKRTLVNALPQLSTDAERQLGAELQEVFGQYLRATQPLLDTRPRAVRKDTSAQVHGAILDASTPALDTAEKLVAAQDLALADFFAQSERSLDSLQRLSQISIVAILVLLTALAALVYRTAVAPLRIKLGETKAVLQRQEKLASLGVFAAGVAHEIRNPLTAIKFRLFSLKKALPAPFGDQEDVTVIRLEIDRLEKIVKDFLLFARPSEPELRPVSADEILQDAGMLLGVQLASRGVELKIDGSNGTLVQADKSQIQQVLINLTQNAADSIEARGEITLRARADVAELARDRRMTDGEDPASPAPVIVFEVADTGKGIPADVVDRIFDPFFSTKDGGTGLGLPIAARIVEQHGGFIQCHTTPGRGTVFSVILRRWIEAPLPVSDGSKDSNC